MDMSSKRLSGDPIPPVLPIRGDRQNNPVTGVRLLVGADFVAFGVAVQVYNHFRAKKSPDVDLSRSDWARGSGDYLGHEEVVCVDLKNRRSEHLARIDVALDRKTGADDQWDIHAV